MSTEQEPSQVAQPVTGQPPVLSEDTKVQLKLRTIIIIIGSVGVLFGGYIELRFAGKDFVARTDVERAVKEAMGAELKDIKRQLGMLSDVFCRTIKPEHKKLLCPIMITYNRKSESLQVMTMAIWITDEPRLRQQGFVILDAATLTNSEKLSYHLKHRMPNLSPVANIFAQYSDAKLEKQASNIIAEIVRRDWRESDAVYYRVE